MPRLSLMIQYLDRQKILKISNYSLMNIKSLREEEAKNTTANGYTDKQKILARNTYGKQLKP